MRRGPKDLEDVVFELGKLPKVVSLLSIRFQPFLAATTFSHQSGLVQSFIELTIFTAFA